MRINAINKISMKQSEFAKYKQRRAAYVRERLEKSDSQSFMKMSADPLLEIGLLMLVSDKIFTKNKKTTYERLGIGLTIAGAAMIFAQMFKNAYLSTKYIKEYDKKNSTDTHLDVTLSAPTSSGN